MSVDIGDILHVLAHELRTPVGIAHGYIRLLLEDRLPQEAERRRALEQLQKALGRLSDLSQESSALANWFERDDGVVAPVNARSILEAALAVPIGSPVTADTSRVPETAIIGTADRPQLEKALASMVRSTARELRGRPCQVTGRADGRELQLLIGDAAQFDALDAGPDASGAGPMPIDRGGLGLSLVHARVVLDANGGRCWSANGSRQAIGVRLPMSD